MNWRLRLTDYLDNGARIQEIGHINDACVPEEYLRRREQDTAMIASLSAQCIGRYYKKRQGDSHGHPSDSSFKRGRDPLFGYICSLALVQPQVLTSCGQTKANV